MLKDFVVLYQWEGSFIPLAFTCKAENGDHAEEQCLDAYPTADVVWVEPGDNVGEAFVSYWDVSGDPVLEEVEEIETPAGHLEDLKECNQ